MGNQSPIPSGTPPKIRIGHIHLKVNNLEVSTAFYKDILGFKISEGVPGQFIFLTAAESHHEIALQQNHIKLNSDIIEKSSLYHIAFEVCDKNEFSKLLRILSQHQIDYSLIDHRISWAAYFNDPDGNGVEIFIDQRKEQTGQTLWEGQSRRLLIEQ